MPPPQLPRILPRGQPKIGNSFGGFIALVVSLSVIILVSSAAVFILLRRTVSDAERTARRRRRRRYQHSALPTSSSGDFQYSQSSDPGSASTGILSRIRRLFGWSRNQSTRGGTKTPSYVRTKNGAGWQQADSGDEWDDCDIPDTTSRPHQASLTSQSRQLMEESSSSPHPASVPATAPRALSSAGAPAALLTRQQKQQQQQNHHTQTPSDSSTLPFLQTQHPPPASTSSFADLPESDEDDAADITNIPRASSPEPMAGFSADSPATTTNTTPGTTRSSGAGRNSSGVAEFAGGTKFIEGL